MKTRRLCYDINKHTVATSIQGLYNTTHTHTKPTRSTSTQTHTHSINLVGVCLCYYFWLVKYKQKPFFLSNCSNTLTLYNLSGFRYSLFTVTLKIRFSTLTLRGYSLVFKLKGHWCLHARPYIKQMPIHVY